MKIVVLDYIDGSVDIIDAPVSFKTEEETEKWLQERGYNLACISWMSRVKQISFYNEAEN